MKITNLYVTDILDRFDLESVKKLIVNADTSGIPADTEIAHIVRLPADEYLATGRRQHGVMVWRIWVE